MQKVNIALISTLYNTKGADFYKEIYFPVIKYAAMSIYYDSDASEKYFDITSLQERVSDKIGITIPISVLRNSLKALSRKTDSDIILELYQKGDYFVVKRNCDISVNEAIEHESNTLSTSFREIDICFQEYLQTEKLTSKKQFADLFNESSEDVARYINSESSSTIVNEDYVNVIRFINWLKESNPKYYDVVNTLLWGSIIAGFLQRKKIEADIKVISNVEYYLDTSIILSLLGLDSEENIRYARDLVRIISESGSTPAVHALTLRELSRILQRVEIDQSPKPGTSIEHAWVEQDLCLSDILKIRNNLETKLNNEFGITVRTYSSSILDDIENKYKNNMDVKALAEERGSHGEDKPRDIHDVFMRDYVQKINRDKGGAELENQSAYFVSLNGDLISFANREGQIESVIHASRVVLSLWIHSTNGTDIQNVVLTEAISRCFALNQTDVRRKLRLFQKHYNNCQFCKDDISNMYSSLIRRSEHTIAEVDRLEVADKSDSENKELECSEIIKGVIEAVKEEAENRKKSMSSMQEDIKELTSKIAQLDNILSESQSGNNDKDQIIQQFELEATKNKEFIEKLQAEIKRRNQIAKISEEINGLKDELSALDIQRSSSVSLFKFWFIIIAEGVAVSALLTLLIFVIIKWDKERIFSALNIASTITLLGLILRLNSMYLLAPGPSKTKVRKDQLDYWDENNPRRKELIDKIRELEQDKKKIECI